MKDESDLDPALQTLPGLGRREKGWQGSGVSVRLSDKNKWHDKGCKCMGNTHRKKNQQNAKEYF